jgi:acetoin utilization deacetylase AcuC-like enzyme
MRIALIHPAIKNEFLGNSKRLMALETISVSVNFIEADKADFSYVLRVHERSYLERVKELPFYDVGVKV